MSPSGRVPAEQREHEREQMSPDVKQQSLLLIRSLRTPPFTEKSEAVPTAQPRTPLEIIRGQAKQSIRKRPLLWYSGPAQRCDSEKQQETHVASSMQGGTGGGGMQSSQEPGSRD
ncbi:hypothetical protein FQN60_015284 [Etheostoma spectabile]|uniref:Uncharacterized protein n=1 Tax=Etheostoma spectabile TaxID=54343 RepID=A0A5J5CTT5_9PERO|nr:hypothetical protein FQN60_015284 [Etheostoma spectabile]